MINAQSQFDHEMSVTTALPTGAFSARSNVYCYYSMCLCISTVSLSAVRAYVYGPVGKQQSTRLTVWSQQLQVQG